MAANSSNKRIWRYVLGVALVAACVFTALQIREFFLLSPAGSSSDVLSNSASGVREAWADDSPFGNPLELRHMHEQAGALSRYAGDPGGIAPPAGAEAAQGWQQRSHGATRQLRTYHCPQPLDDVAAHYRRAAAEKSLTPMDDQPGQGTLLMQWASTGLHMSVNLQETSGQTVATVTTSRSEGF
ncbi:MAG: hypothetical protein FWE88_08465 [Phycisphaerae bacterium]|nr:hypothetical protein [Phycisphaerae bacterium]